MLAYRALAYVGNRWYGYERDGAAQRLPFNLYMKYGPRVRPAEGVAMEWVTRHTTIPSPRLLDMLQGNLGTCLIMTRFPGVAFGDEQTLYDLSPEQVQAFEDTLRDWFTQLRSIPVPPDATISSVDGSPCRCNRVSCDHDFGPFSTEEGFQAFLFRSVPKPHHAELRAKVETMASRHHRLLFTHADVYPNNFLVQDGRLIGWIDWECAGWYPEYWDYTRALFLRANYRPWCNIFTRIFPHYDTEFTVEDAFWMVSDPY